MRESMASNIFDVTAPPHHRTSRPSSPCTSIAVARHFRGVVDGKSWLLGLLVRVFSLLLLSLLS